jgi:hypothetical protein
MEPKQKIPLTLGFANLSGDDLGSLVSEDIGVLGPLFERINAPAPHLLPKSEILFVYAHLNEDGTIHGLNIRRNPPNCSGNAGAAYCPSVTQFGS